MNNLSMVIKYVDPDPTSALYVGIWFAIVGVFGIPLNIFIVIATVKVQEIRAVSSNMFIGSLALSDAISMLSFLLHLLYALTPNETLCKVIGFGLSTFVVLGSYIMPFLALHRYSVVCRQQERLAQYVFEAFSRKGIYLTIFLLWAFQITSQLPFVFRDTLGMHSIGICTTTKKSANDPFISIYYYCGTLGVFALSNLPVLIFYRKVSSWVKTMSVKFSLSGETKQTIRETKNVLLLTKWVTLSPIILSSPILLMAVLFEFNSEIVSVGVSRLIISSYPLSPLFNAIITLIFARPYKLTLKRVCERRKLTSTLFSWIIEGRWLHKIGAVDDSPTSVFVARSVKSQRNNTDI